MPEIRVGNLARNQETNIIHLVCRACGRCRDLDVMAQRWSYDLPILEALATVQCECGATAMQEIPS